MIPAKDVIISPLISDCNLDSPFKEKLELFYVVLLKVSKNPLLGASAGRLFFHHLFLFGQFQHDYAESMGIVDHQPRFLSCILTLFLQGACFASCWMMNSDYISEDMIVNWRIWVFPSILLSLLLGAQFTQNTMLVMVYFCRYLAYPISRDEVKGRYPIAYEEKLTEAILAVLLFAICSSIVVCWTGGWRLLKIQPWWFILQTGWVLTRVHTTTLFKLKLRRLSNDGLHSQAVVRLYLYSLYDSFCPLVHDVFVAWPYRYFLRVTLLYGFYPLNTDFVKGPCLKAPVRQGSMPANSLRFATRAWTFIIFFRLRRLYIFGSFLITCAHMDRALRHLLGRSDCLDMSQMIGRTFAVLIGHLMWFHWISSLVCWIVLSLKWHMLLYSEAHWLYLQSYSK